MEGVKKEMTEIKGSVHDTRAELDIEKGERKKDIAAFDGRMKSLEEKFAGLGGG